LPWAQQDIHVPSLNIVLARARLRDLPTDEDLTFTLIELYPAWVFLEIVRLSRRIHQHSAHDDLVRFMGRASPSWFCQISAQYSPHTRQWH